MRGVTTRALSTVQDRLVAATQDHPEWNSWTTPLAEALRQMENPIWDAISVEVSSKHPDHAPLLDHATIRLDAKAAGASVRRIMDAAADAGGAEASELRTVARGTGFEALALLEATVCQDDERLTVQAASLGVERNVLVAVGLLAAMPLLDACRRKTSDRAPASWPHGYCLVCGAWAALAELRGLERTRHLRCGRCGTGWDIEWVRCAYCRASDNSTFSSLVPEDGVEARRVDVCRGCRGYTKLLTSARAWPAGQVPVEDLASVDLDLIAVEHGFERPETVGYAVRAQIGEMETGRRIMGWRL